MKKGEIYTTLDVYQAAYLVLNGSVPQLLKENERIVFAFQLSAELLECLLSYNAGALVKANEFTNVIKLLKSRVFALKREYSRRPEKGE